MKKSSVYTKTGDKGTTSLVGGKRVPKSHVRLNAYGTVDELNSFIGWLACEIKDENDLKVLSYIQHKLFTVGSYLATETETMQPREASIITDRDITFLETQMDTIDATLTPFKRFILPGGNEAAGRAHICRTVCRRAERCIYDVKGQYPVNDEIIIFINRLSDYLFLLARKECNKTGTEIFWDQQSI